MTVNTTRDVRQIRLVEIHVRGHLLVEQMLNVELSTGKPSVPALQDTLGTLMWNANKEEGTNAYATPVVRMQSVVTFLMALSVLVCLGALVILMWAVYAMGTSKTYAGKRSVALMPSAGLAPMDRLNVTVQQIIHQEIQTKNVLWIVHLLIAAQKDVAKVQSVFERVWHLYVAAHQELRVDRK